MAESPGDLGYGGQNGASTRAVGNNPSRRAPRIRDVFRGARRVLIARGLVHDPRALILDEPATSLDLRARRELREILRKIARSGTSVILVTHDPADIFPEINRVILLKDGTVLEDGRKEDILASAHLSRLFGMPVELVERNGYYHLLDG